MDGIVFHPEAPGVRYCRTDMGGAYRWDAASNQWTPLLDWISLDESNLQGGGEHCHRPAESAERVYCLRYVYQ
mgnify:FL=1